MALIFKILCGILYVIGLCFGLTYKEISVDICIYACPAICVICAALSVITGSNKTWLKRAFLSMNIALLLFYVNMTYVFWKHFSSFADPFTVCMDDLMEVARKNNITYEEANIYLYCYLFFAIIFFHLSQVFYSLVIAKRKKAQVPCTAEPSNQADKS